jgi:hypothetical protein
MAGNYPDAPSWRMAYDRDGTVGLYINGSNVITTMTSGQMAVLNDESDAFAVNSADNNPAHRLVLIFPELRDIDGYFRNLPADNSVAEVSADTTNGLDGTWITISSSASTSAVAAKPTYRTGVVSTTHLAKRAIRFTNVRLGSMRNLHLYGEPAPGENPNRLALWHPTLDQRVTPAYFDWGNVPRSSSGDRLFRVKNLSATMTAASVRVAMETLTDASPSVPGQHAVSSDGTTFLAQVNIGSLSPGAISGPVTLRRITPSNAVLSLWSFRVFAESTSWS